MSRRGSRCRAIEMLILVAVGLGGAVTAANSSWAIGGLTCVSDDDHLYFILRGNVSNKGTQVTSVAITSERCGSTCIEAPPGDGILTAFSAGPGALLPNRMRTTVLNGKGNSSISCADFNPNANGGMGLLTMPAGGTVSAGGGTIPLVDVHTADAVVPAAVDLVSESRTIPPFVCSGSTMVFPLPNPQQSGCPGSGTTQVVESSVTTGEQDCQTVTFDETNQSPIGNIAGGTIDHAVGPHLQTVPDGFLLQGTCSSDADCQTIVFVGWRGSASDFGVAAAGFKITTTNEIFGTDGFSPNDCFHNTPTPTPTPTRIPIANECSPSAPDSCPVGKTCNCCCGTYVCMPPYLPCCALPCSDETPLPTPTPNPTCPPLPPFQCLPDYEKVCETTDGCTTCQCVLRATPTSTPTAPECDQNCNGSCGSFSCGPGACVAIDSGCACAPPECPTLTFLPTPTPTPTATSRTPQFCEPTPCPPGLVCVIDPPFQSRVCACVGDCNDDYGVEVDELVTMVNIALGNAATSTCRFGDGNGDGEITVDEILLAVGNALYGCGMEPTPKPYPLPTPTVPHGQTCCECPIAACTDFAWMELPFLCPLGCQTFMDAECEAPCHGGGLSGPAICVPLTPCTSDADCDDGNGCTADHCTSNGCAHDCVCV